MPSFNLNPLPGRENLSHEASVMLRQAIKSGQIPPGSHLVEQELADQLGISRIPVREAIQYLVNEGLAIKEARRGAYVHPYSERELEEVYSVRVLLERFTAERVIANWTQDSYAQLMAIADNMSQAAQQNDRDRIYELDSQFHEALWKMAQHTVLLELISSLRSRISRFLFEANSALSFDALEKHVRLHYDLIEILNNGDIAAAQTEISGHIMAARDRIKSFYAYLGK